VGGNEECGKFLLWKPHEKSIQMPVEGQRRPNLLFCFTYLYNRDWIKLNIYQPKHTAVIFHICSAVHRNSRSKKSNKMQQYADMYLLLNYSTCFGRPPRPSSGIHKSVVAASGTDHNIWGASFFKRDQIRTGLGPYGPKPVVIRYLLWLYQIQRYSCTK